MNNLMFPIKVLKNDPSHNEFLRDEKFKSEINEHKHAKMVSSQQQEAKHDRPSKPLNRKSSENTNTHTIVRMLSTNMC
jgi:hypothetical protein